MKVINFISNILNTISLFGIFFTSIFLLYGINIWGNIEFSQLYTFIMLNISDATNYEDIGYIILISAMWASIGTLSLLVLFYFLKTYRKPFIPVFYVFIYSLVILFVIEYFSLSNLNELIFLSFLLMSMYIINLRRNYSAINITGFVVLLGIFASNLFSINSNDYLIVELFGNESQKNDFATEFKLPQNKMIAHACGGIDGFVYTNSLEALERSVARGYKYIEIDLLKYTDNSSGFFAAHDYDMFKSMTGADKYTKNMISEYQILGKYTPLTDESILNFFNTHPDIWLVTDKVTDFAMLDEKLGKLKNRIILEFWTSEQYQSAKQHNFKYGAYSVNNLKELKFAEDNKFEFITVSTQFLDEAVKEIQKLRLKNKVKVMVYTAKDKKEARKYGYFADMIYYDGEEKIERK